MFFKALKHIVISFPKLALAWLITQTESVYFKALEQFEGEPSGIVDI